MLKRKCSAALVLAASAATLAVLAGGGDPGGGRGNGPVIYVTSQGLFYDSIVTADVPRRGPFQLLEEGGPSGLMTEFGPGDAGYYGGRWWVDVNGNQEMDDEDRFFVCPLLPPGRDAP
jgi:hypothetical protein